MVEANSQSQARAGSGRRSRSLLAVLILFLIVYLGSAFSPSLQDDADSTHAEAAREMLVRGDYVTLHINGVRYLEKAPLMYWLVAFSFKILGINELATRIPTLLAMLGLILLAIRWATRAWGARTGIYAGLFVCTAAGFFLFTRILIPDTILSFFIALSMYFFLTALEDETEPWRWYAGHVCMALAVLTKGLLPLVVIGFPLIFYIVLTGEWRRWKKFHLVTGLLLFFAIATPWHLLAGYRNPRFFWFYFINEHFLRFLGERYPKDYNKLPAALYWGLHLVWLFPWSVYLPVAFRRVWEDLRARKEKKEPRTISFAGKTTLLCWLWAGVLLTFFSFSTNQEYYTVPAYFPFLLLLAAAVAGDEEAEKTGWLKTMTAVSAVVSLAAAGVLFAGLWSSRHVPFVPDIGTVLAKPNLADETLSMGHITELTGESFAALRLPAILAMIALGVGPLVALWLRIKRRSYMSTWVTALTMGVFLVAAHIALVRFDPFLSSKRLATAIQKVEQPGDEVMIYGDQAFGSSLLFYLRQPIYLVNGRTTSMWFGSTYPDAPHIFLKDADLLREWHSAKRVFLFVPRYERNKVNELLPETKYVVAQSSDKIIYSNRP